MKEVRFALIILSITAFLFACSNDTHQYSSNIEQVLPGKWRIESVYLPAVSEGITYQDKTFFQDTTLLDVGEIEFTPFEFYSSEWYTPVSTTIVGYLKIDNESFLCFFNNLIIDHGTVHGFFSLGVSEEIDTIDTPGEEFVWSSRIFNANYRLLFDGDQHVQLESFRDHVIDLQKIE